MINWLKLFRQRWFPTPAERYKDGWAFAEAHFGGCSSPDEFDYLYESLPWNDLKDPFDRAIRDYARSVNWGA